MSLVRPQKELLTKTQATYDSRKQLADGLGAALAAQRKSDDELNYARDEIDFLTGTANRKGRFRSLYFGDINGNSDANQAARLITWHRWLNEYYRGFGFALSDELVRIATESGVTLKTDDKIQVDAPPRNPEDVTPPTHSFMLPLSNSNGGSIKISITGDLPHILKFLNGINQSSILLVVGTIKLEGYSPLITASFPLTPYLLASGPGAAPGNDAASTGAPSPMRRPPSAAPAPKSAANSDQE
ncbi:MAG: hypothetical protein ABI210_03140 [Abditibacteriaceae bacterium]